MTADGTADGDLAAVVDRVMTALASEGWTVTASSPPGSTPSPAPALRVIARRDDVVAQALITGTLGTTPAPAGSQWVQLSVAHPDDRIGWTTTP